ncbi:hypothetical protein JTE90_014391 [Oedothorax gibbosus]|uniref:Uncharacterized protein n=1 Tax=Oedothorax gibbosus TaxID=931172 RepID=A0AAV6V4S9_9ARAC|nr:hypothetical protein JTE90_014391 [Oedothorax gibbosus]
MIVIIVHYFQTIKTQLLQSQWKARSRSSFLITDSVHLPELFYEANYFNVHSVDVCAVIESLDDSIIGQDGNERQDVIIGHNRCRAQGKMHTKLSIWRRTLALFRNRRLRLSEMPFIQQLGGQSAWHLLRTTNFKPQDSVYFHETENICYHLMPLPGCIGFLLVQSVPIPNVPERISK